MKTKFIDTAEIYDGSQLVSLRSYLKHGLLGDSIVAWVGPCKVSLDHMVDGEDLVAGAEIRGDLMLHFVIEKFESTLLAAVGLQRLLAAIVQDELRDLVKGIDIRRDGDDIFIDEGKFSISIATQSPVSSLIHFAVNVVNEGTPVKTSALGDLGLEPKPFALKIMNLFAVEVGSIVEATRKVRWVR